MKRLLTIAFTFGLVIISWICDAQTAYITNGASASVSVINVTTNSVVSTIPVGIEPGGVSVSPDGSKVYVTNATAHSVSVINTATNTVSSTIIVGMDPFHVTISPDGSKAYHMLRIGVVIQ